jgi:hypothetical protein
MIGFGIWKLQEQSDQNDERIRQEKWNATGQSSVNVNPTPRENTYNTQPLSVSVTDIYDDWMADRTLANSKYVGRRWSFKGTVSAVLVGQAQVFLQDTTAISGHIATVSGYFTDDPSVVNSISVGQTITISGEIQMVSFVDLSNEFWINMKNCKIE